MSDRRGLLALDAPVVDQSRFRGQPGVDRPKPAPSLIEQFSVAARGAAANDDPGADQARQQEAIDTALAPLVADLQRRGIAGDYTARRARDGFALSYNDDAIWQGIARARAADPKAFEGVDADPAAFRTRVTAPVRARIADERDVQQRSSWVPWLAGQFVGGTSDPVNQAGMLAGLGPARSIAQAAIRDAVVNTQIEAVQAPVRAIAKAKRGEDTTVGEVARDLGLAAGTGAAFGGAVHGAGELAGKAAARLKGPAGELADRMRSAIGVDRMTDAERAAAATLDRIDEVSAISPFVPGAGGDAHLARMDSAAAQLAQPPSAPGAAAPTSAAPRFDPQTYANRVAVAESGGKWQVQAPTSSAYGLYQITEGTWWRYAQSIPTLKALGKEGAWARRTNPAAQEAVFGALTRDNRAALARGGVPETYGNMYLLHFAGSGAGMRILRAAPDEPIERILSAKAIEANAFLKGKTAGDVVAWAHAKVGETPHVGPVLSREGFADDGAGDVAWRAAQAEADAADRELARVAAENAGARAPVEDDIPFDLDDPRGRVFDREARDPFDDVPPDLIAASPNKIDAAEGFDRAPFSNVVHDRGVIVGAADASSHVTERGYVYRSLSERELAAIRERGAVLAPEGRSKGGRDNVKHWTRGDGEMFYRGDQTVIRVRDTAIDPGRPVSAADVEVRGADGTFRPIADTGRLYHGTRGEWSDANPNGLAMTFYGETRDVAERYAAGRGGRRSTSGAERIVERDMPPADRILDLTTREGHAILASLAPVGGRADEWIAQAARGLADMDAPGGDASALWRLSTNVWQLSKNAEGTAAESIARLVSRLRDHDYEAIRFTDDQHSTVAVFDDVPKIEATEVAGTATAAEGFDSPDDVAALRQMESLEHDLRMFLLEDDAKGLTVRLNDEGDVVSAADAIADLDADEAAIAAARACMVPPGGDMA